MPLPPLPALSETLLSFLIDPPHMTEQKKEKNEKVPIEHLIRVVQGLGTDPEPIDLVNVTKWNSWTTQVFKCLVCERRCDWSYESVFEWGDTRRYTYISSMCDSCLSLLCSKSRNAADSEYVFEHHKMKGNKRGREDEEEEEEKPVEKKPRLQKTLMLHFASIHIPSHRKKHGLALDPELEPESALYLYTKGSADPRAEEMLKHLGNKPGVQRALDSLAQGGELTDFSPWFGAGMTRQHMGKWTLVVDGDGNAMSDAFCDEYLVYFFDPIVDQHQHQMTLENEKEAKQ